MSRSSWASGWATSVQRRKDKLLRVPRWMSITKAYLEKYGFTAGCLGSRAWLIGRSRQEHSEECRGRLEKETKDDPKLKQSKERGKEFLQRALRREEERREKQENQKREETIAQTDVEIEGAAGGVFFAHRAASSGANPRASSSSAALSPIVGAPASGLPKRGFADAGQGGNKKPRGSQMNMKRDAEVGELRVR